MGGGNLNPVPWDLDNTASRLPKDVEEQSSHSAAVYWQGCLNPRSLDSNFPMEYDSPPDVAASPPREPGVPPREPGVPEMSTVISRTGVEARPRGLSRFDTPPLGDQGAANQAPPSRVSAPHDAFPRRHSDSALVECLLHSLEMAHSPDVSGVAAGVVNSFGIEERSLISRILTGIAGGNIISAARARTRAEYLGEGKILIAPYSSRLGQHSTRRTSCPYPNEHKMNRAVPALLGCR